MRGTFLAKMRFLSTPQPTKFAALIAATCISGCGGDSDGNGTPVGTVSQASAAIQCNGFLGRSINGAKITSASLVGPSGTIPEYCSVRGEMPKDLDFELHLPTTWNKRTIFTGGGGFAGVINAPNPELLSSGYATISTNHGHNEAVMPGAEFALDAQMLADYAYSAVPKVLVPAKTILSERYGRDYLGTKMVYKGCSGGGRQALIQAQRYPDLFDGVIAEAPANSYISQFLYYQKVDRQLSQPGASLSAEKILAVDRAVMAKCDAMDGLADNMIGRPNQCTFDPIELACTGAETNSCLTSAQVQSARTIYASTNVANGKYSWPSFPVGGEASLLGWSNSFITLLGSGFIKYMVTQNASTDWLAVDPAQYTSRIDQLSTMIDATDPDLSRFNARGGKVLLWTGLTDWMITANNATDYYQSVVQKAGGQAAADEFIEYYTSPGVSHCGSGTGADGFDLAGPMFDWIEKGTKPATNQIIATRREFDLFGARQSPVGAVAPSRPLCQYPKYPKYIGGDVNAASSFVCSTT